MAASQGKHRPVAKGGFWNNQQPVYSQETQKLLKEMMKESKLTNFQQRQLSSRMSAGQSLPTACHPTSSAKPTKREPPRPPSKIIDPRSHRVEIRTLDQIESSGDLERPLYELKPTKVRSEEDKVRLANIMAYGEELPPPDPRKVRARAEVKEKPKVDRFDELVAEVEERRGFLDEMEGLGKGKDYRVIIETEISQLIREMEVLDKKRSLELQRAISRDEKRRQTQDKTSIPQVTDS